MEENVKIKQNWVFCVGLLPPAKFKMLMDHGSELTQNTPTPLRTGTSHGRLGDFMSKVTQNNHPPPPPRPGTSHGGLGDFGSEITVHPVKRNDCSFGTFYNI